MAVRREKPHGEASPRLMEVIRHGKSENCVIVVLAGQRQVFISRSALAAC